jgi:hypothetical protein
MIGGKPMKSQSRKGAESTCGERARTLSVADESVRAVRDHVCAAKARIEVALGFVMFPEVRQELRKARSHLDLTLSYIGG